MQTVAYEGLFEEVDSSALACLPLGGRQGSRSGEVAQESLFSEIWCEGPAVQRALVAY
jgi:hypothetical protein